MQPWASGPQLAIGTPSQWRGSWGSDAIPRVCTHRKTPSKAEHLVKVCRRRLQKAKFEELSRHPAAGSSAPDLGMGTSRGSPAPAFSSPERFKMTQEKKEGQDLSRAAHRCVFPPFWSSS